MSQNLCLLHAYAHTHAHTLVNSSPPQMVKPDSVSQLTTLLSYLHYLNQRKSSQGDLQLFYKIRNVTERFSLDLHKSYWYCDVMPSQCSKVTMTKARSLLCQAMSTALNCEKMCWQCVFSSRSISFEQVKSQILKETKIICRLNKKTTLSLKCSD